MRDPLGVTQVSLTPSSGAEQRDGFVGWVCLELAIGLRLDGLGVRCTADGRIQLGYPTHVDSRGDRRAYFAPSDEHARRRIERQVFEALDMLPRGKASP